MRLVRQYNEIDCGICVAAMISGRTWTQAVKADGKPDCEEGLSVAEFVELCQKLDRPVRVTRSQYGKPLWDLDVPAGLVALLVRKPGDTWGHFVAFEKGIILDPDSGRQSLRKFARTNWAVIRMFVA